MIVSIDTTPYKIAERYIGLKELTGGQDHPFIQWCFSLCGYSLETPDETPWCSAFMQHPCWELRLPRSKSAAARSWLRVGTPCELEDASADFVVAIFKRGQNQPGPEVTSGAPGHVGFYAGIEDASILVLGGNQSDGVTLQPFPISQLLGLRRLV